MDRRLDRKLAHLSLDACLQPELTEFYRHHLLPSRRVTISNPDPPTLTLTLTPYPDPNPNPQTPTASCSSPSMSTSPPWRSVSHLSWVKGCV